MRRSRWVVLDRAPLAVAMAFAMTLAACNPDVGRQACRESAETIQTTWGGSSAECPPGAIVTVTPSGDGNHAVVTCRCPSATDAGTE